MDVLTVVITLADVCLEKEEADTLSVVVSWMLLCDSDTENDDTVMSTRSQRTAAATASARLDDIIDDDSDFEVSSKQRVSTSAVTRREATKY